MKNHYFIIDETAGDIYETAAGTNKAAAIKAARAEFEALTQHDKNRRRSFYVVRAELDEDGYINYDTVFTVYTVK